MLRAARTPREQAPGSAASRGKQHHADADEGHCRGQAAPAAVAQITKLQELHLEARDLHWGAANRRQWMPALQQLSRLVMQSPESCDGSADEVWAALCKTPCLPHIRLWYAADPCFGISPAPSIAGFVHRTTSLQELRVLQARNQPEKFFRECHY